MIYLMLINKEVMQLNNTLTQYRVLNEKLLPYALYYIKRSTGFIEDIRLWISNRFIYKNLASYKSIMNSLNLDQRTQYRLNIVMQYHAASVTDGYWLRYSDDEQYKDVSLHKHKIKELVMDVALLRILSSLQLSDMHANVDLQGTFPKTWVRKRDGLNLYKTDTNNGINVYSELMANDILNQTDIVGCNYYPVDYKGNICTGSKCFTNNEVSLVTYSEYSVYCKTNRINSLSIFGHAFDKMCLFDYIIGNTDRHLDNFGVLVNNYNNRVECIAPLYDFNISMQVTKDLNNHLRTFLYKPTQKPFLQSALDALSRLNGQFNLDLDNIPDYVEQRIKILKASYK